MDLQTQNDTSLLAEHAFARPQRTQARSGAVSTGIHTSPESNQRSGCLPAAGSWLTWQNPIGSEPCSSRSSSHQAMISRGEGISNQGLPGFA